MPATLRVLGIALLAAVSCSASVRAAGKLKLNEADQARVTMRTYFSCLAAKAGTKPVRDRVLAVLRVSPRSAGADKVGSKLATGSCLEKSSTGSTYVASLRFKMELMRGEIFRALYLERARTPVRVSFTPADLADGWSLPGDDPTAVLQRFGDCVVERDRAGADAAIRQEVASEAETQAYRALAPALNLCLEKGATFRFSRSVLEGVLGEALYKQSIMRNAEHA